MINLEKFKKYCIAKWNGNGKDVFQESLMIALERYRNLENCNLSLLCNIAKEAVRNLRIYEFQASRQDGVSIISPRSQKTRERLKMHYATAAADEKTSLELDERKKYFLQKIREYKQKGYNDEKIIAILKPLAKQKQRTLF